VRILIVEDHPDIVKLMSYLLRSFEHSVAIVTDGEDALAAAIQEPFDLIICDIQMPKLDGYEVARQLKANAKLAAIPLVAVTALEGEKAKLLAAGFAGSITKPIWPRTFVSQVEAFLRAPPCQQQAACAPEPPCRSGKVLIVGNSPVDIELTKWILEPFGFEVHSAATMLEALAPTRENVPDVVLCDFHLALQTGVGAMRALNADPAARLIPFILISSAFIDERDHEKGLALGADKIMVRPFPPQQLIAEIRNCMSNRKKA
jgi:two-component system cell cycle response regulator